ncbi:hypothetical protein D3C81_2114200 [compost metagenome]
MYCFSAWINRTLRVDALLPGLAQLALQFGGRVVAEHGEGDFDDPMAFLLLEAGGLDVANGQDDLAHLSTS